MMHASAAMKLTLEAGLEGAALGRRRRALAQLPQLLQLAVLQGGQLQQRQAVNQQLGNLRPEVLKELINKT